MADKRIAYAIAETEDGAQDLYRTWVRSSETDRRILEARHLCFKGVADARYMLTEFRKTESDENHQLWAIALTASRVELAVSATGVPPYRDGDIITVYDREYGCKYRARVEEDAILAGGKRPWLVHFESLQPIEPNESRHYVGSLEADDDGSSPWIVNGNIPERGEQ